MTVRVSSLYTTVKLYPNDLAVNDSEGKWGRLH